MPVLLLQTISNDLSYVAGGLFKPTTIQIRNIYYKDISDAIYRISKYLMLQPYSVEPTLLHWCQLLTRHNHFLNKITHKELCLSSLNLQH